MKLSKFLPVIIAVMIVGVLLLAGIAWPRQAEGARNTLALNRPPFLEVAYAQEGTSPLDIGAKLDAEAGISAYYKSPVAIDLNTAKTAYRTIETQTSDYIIGSVAITGYAEHYDAHVYAHKDGWMLAYYLRQDPVAKIVDVVPWSISNTKLRSALATVAGAAGAPFTAESYYDFRYPNATHMLLIAEDKDNGRDFTLQLPSTYGYYERSWSAKHTWPWYMKLNGVDLSPSYEDPNSRYGWITAGQLIPNTTHTFEVGHDYGVVVIVYSVP